MLLLNGVEGFFGLLCMKVCHIDTNVRKDLYQSCLKGLNRNKELKISTSVSTIKTEMLNRPNNRFQHQARKRVHCQINTACRGVKDRTGSHALIYSFSRPVWLHTQTYTHTLGGHWEKKLSSTLLGEESTTQGRGKTVSPRQSKRYILP